jgi:hypothetical protein
MELVGIILTEEAEHPALLYLEAAPTATAA